MAIFVNARQYFQETPVGLITCLTEKEDMMARTTAALQAEFQGEDVGSLPIHYVDVPSKHSKPSGTFRVMLGNRIRESAPTLTSSPKPQSSKRGPSTPVPGSTACGSQTAAPKPQSPKSGPPSPSSGTRESGSQTESPKLICNCHENQDLQQHAPTPTKEDPVRIAREAADQRHEAKKASRLMKKLRHQPISTKPSAAKLAEIEILKTVLNGLPAEIMALLKPQATVQHVKPAPTVPRVKDVLRCRCNCSSTDEGNSSGSERSISR